MDCFNTNSAFDTDLTGYSNAPEDMKQRAVYLMGYLIKHGQLLDFQAAAIAGVCAKESSIIPNRVNKTEQNGNGTAYTRDGGYGAGICQWTGNLTKLECLKTAGAQPGIKVEQLSMDKQASVIINWTQTKPTWKCIRFSRYLAEATATFFCTIAGSKWVKRLNAPSTVEEAEAAAKVYDKGRKSSFGKSLKFATDFLDAYQNFKGNTSSINTYPITKKKVEIKTVKHPSKENTEKIVTGLNNLGKINSSRPIMQQSNKIFRFNM